MCQLRVDVTLDYSRTMKQKFHTSRIGKYTLAGVLGQGGMGYVYRAISSETGQSVALKLLNSSGPLAEFLDDATLREIFSTEVLTMSRLHHPNIAEVLDFDFDNDRPYYTMEFFCNNLGMMIGERFVLEETSRLIPPDKAVDYGCQILAGLECMHTEGIIHRDIKPFNMMVTDKNTIKICDFGMAMLEEEESFNTEGINIGSPYYAAPEQISDPEHADARSDLYSAGVLLYRMLTGELPAMKDFMLSRVDPLYDQAWDAFFAQALSWKPELRFQSAGEMAEGLMQLELHWKKKKKLACRTYVQDVKSGKEFALRTYPVRTSGTRAREVFDVDNLWKPRSYIDNKLRLTGTDLVVDDATGLIWQHVPSDYLLDRQSADEFIDSLNEIRSGGIRSWRLPTVNELLSLATDPALPAIACRENPFLTGEVWFWTCDRRSAETSWYVNISLGYTGWQHDSCLYSVRAVG